MPYRSVREILGNVQVFHEQLRLWAAARAETPDEPGSDAMLEHVAYTERTFRQALDGFADKKDEGHLLDTWIQYVPERELQQTFEIARVEPGMPVEEVVRRLIAIDGALVAFYDALATALVPPRVADVFRSLRDAQESKSREYSRRIVEWSQEGHHDEPDERGRG